MIRKITSAVALAVLSGTLTAGSLLPYENIPMPADVESVVIADLNGDEVNEIAVVMGWSSEASERGKVHVLSFDPLVNSFVRAGTASIPDLYPNRASAVAADIDGDGVIEVVVGTGSTLTAINWDGATTSTRGMATPVVMEVIQAIDLDTDGRDEIVGQSWSAGAAIFRTDILGNFDLVRQFATGAAGYNDAAVGDLDGDGLPDWVVMSGQLYSAPHAEVFTSNGTGDFVPGSNAFRVASGENMKGIAVGDINADGRDDIVLSRSGNSPTWLYSITQNPAGGFDQATTTPTYDLPSDIAIADLFGDGSNHLVVLHGGWSTLSLYSTSSAGLALAEMKSVPYTSHYPPTALALGDVTGDGCKDVAIAGRAAGLTILRGQDCIVAAPKAADLIAAVNVGRYEAHVAAHSAPESSAAAENIVASIAFTATRQTKISTFSTACTRLSATRFECRWTTLAPSEEAGWSFQVDGPRNHPLSVTATLTSSTEDPNVDNNTATAQR